MTARRFGLIAIVIVAAACQPARTPSPPPPTPDVASPADGVVIAVDSSGLSAVRGFTLRTSGGFAFTFVLGPLENAADFSPSHLAEHQVSSEPIRAWFRVEGGDRVVYRLEDAPG